MQILSKWIVTFAILAIVIGSSCYSSVTTDEENTNNATPVVRTITPSPIILPIITISRVVGTTPFVVQATAAASTATWIDPVTNTMSPLPNPYDQLHYTWNFGEGNGSDTMTHPVTGKVVDADTHQTGPQATFVYREPGAYTITLTASIRDLAGNVTQANTTISVTATPFSGQTQYFDPIAGSDSNNGLTAATPKQSWGAYSSWVSGGDNRRALLKRGTTMIQTSILWSDRSHIRVEPYGIGADPIIQADPSLAGSMLRVWANHFLEDQVYSGIRFNGMGYATHCVLGYGGDDPAARDVAFLNCVFDNSLPNGDSLVILTGNHLSRFAFWNCHFAHNDATGHGIYAYLNGGMAPSEFLSIVGGSFVGGDSHPLLDHHIYANGWRSYDLMRWIDFGACISKNFCLNMNCPSDGNQTKYILIDGCDVTGCQNGIDASNGTNNPALGQFDHFLIQNTSIHDGGTGGSQSIGLMGYCIRRLVLRDSLFYGNLIDMEVADPAVDYNVYRNIYWRDSNVSWASSVNLRSGQQGTFYDNVFEVASSPGLAQKIIKFNGTGSASFDFRRNTYWCPNLISAGQVAPFYDKDTSQSLTMNQWLAIYPNDGPYSNPGFTDPANGQF